MKLWIIAHSFTIFSFLLAVLGAMFISPYIIVSLFSTGMIFLSAERIRKREKANWRKQNDK